MLEALLHITSLNQSIEIITLSNIQTERNWYKSNEFYPQLCGIACQTALQLKSKISRFKKLFEDMSSSQPSGSTLAEVPPNR